MSERSLRALAVGEVSEAHAASFQAVRPRLFGIAIACWKRGRSG